MDGAVNQLPHACCSVRYLPSKQALTWHLGTVGALPLDPCLHVMNWKMAHGSSQLHFELQLLLTNSAGPWLISHVTRPCKTYLLNLKFKWASQWVSSTAGLAPHILSCCNICRCDLTGASVFAQMSPDAAAAGTPMPGCVLSPHLRLQWNMVHMPVMPSGSSADDTATIMSQAMS